MAQDIVTFLILVLIAISGYVAFSLRKLNSQSNGDGVNTMIKAFQGMNERLDSATKEIGKVGEIGRDMKDFKKDFENFFSNPKLRGNLGEQILKDLLTQILPKDNYKLQYSFKEGKTVDAIIKTDKGIIPIDSKFPVENFRKMVKSSDKEEIKSLKKAFVKDVKLHIDSISEKYILPKEGTTNFAIMYVPSETVYYELVMDDAGINDYGQERKVFIVSPNSFYYFLQSVMIGLEGKKVEEKSQSIIETLKGIQKQSDNFGTKLGVLNKHINHAKNSMDDVNNNYSQLDSKINGVKLLK